VLNKIEVFARIERGALEMLAPF